MSILGPETRGGRSFKSKQHREGGYETKIRYMTRNTELGYDVKERAVPNECADAHVHAAQQSIGIRNNNILRVHIC